MEKMDTLKKTGDFIRSSATIKIFSIGILVLILLIPTAMISSLMRERETRRDSVVAEISRKWGDSQTVTGPFFTVPFKYFYKDEKDNLKSDIRYLHILPENVHFSGEITPEVRYRSLYEAVLYNTRLSLQGNFKLPALDLINIDPENVLWEKAVLSVGITDMRGIRDKVAVKFNDLVFNAGPGLATIDVAGSGIQCAVPLSPGKTENTFSLELSLNGSEQIHFVPMGETTFVDLRSSWPSPSFTGAFLPATREISDTGFSASWKILHLNRNFPQLWVGSQYPVYDAAFGLKLLITADIYQKSIRISKYAVMFIVFTFAAFFFSEVITGRRVHPIQYILIGLAIILFYVLLLAVSEHINFDAAYILSALAITTAITGYSHGILRNRYFTATVFGILVILYAYLYIVLQLEDYALLMGSIGLFIVLTTVMYITRKIDWYTMDKGVGHEEAAAGDTE